MSHILHWFRRDLRIHDNTALAHASQLAHERQAKLSAVFVITPKQWAEHDMSAVQMDFILRTLSVLQADLYHQHGIQLHVLSAIDFINGNDNLIEFMRQQQVTHLLANREYEVNEQQRDQQLSDRLAEFGIDFFIHDDQCILPPNTVQTSEGGMYQVFTPFYNKWQEQLNISLPHLHDLADGMLKAWQNNRHKQNAEQDGNHDNWLQTAQNWLHEQHQQLLFSYAHTCELSTLMHVQQQYLAGETAGKHRLNVFIDNDIEHYHTLRDRPADNATSDLSAYLSIGTISPRHCYLMANQASNKGYADTGIQAWISELAWRDFYRHVIVNRPDIVRHQAYKKDIDNKVNWSYDQVAFKRWCDGKTGVPLVDAAMQCLRATGFMHNRLRMVVAMFLTKDLLIDWRWGERYFMQQLIDGDFASNNGGWQWSASVGTDSAPYFRIMNPFSQGNSHDKEGEFIKTWLPQLSDVPASVLHNEQKLAKFLKAHDIDYPLAMVLHKQARLQAIAEFKA